MTKHSVQCTAHSKGSKKQCRSRAILGGTVCWHHGGAAPQVQKKAAERYAEAADKSLAKLTGYVDAGLVEPKVLLDAAVKLREMSEVMEGRVARREEIVNVTTSQLDLEIDKLLGELAGVGQAGAEDPAARTTRKADYQVEPASPD